MRVILEQYSYHSVLADEGESVIDKDQAGTSLSIQPVGSSEDHKARTPCRDSHLAPELGASDMGQDYNLAGLVHFVWRHRLALFAGMVTGALIMGGLGLLLRQERYLSTLLLDIDKTSLPALTDREKLILKANEFVQRPEVLKALLTALFAKDQSIGRLNALITNEVEGSIASQSEGGRKAKEQLIRIVPVSITDSLAVVLALPVSVGFEAVGRDFVAALNQQIKAYNDEQIIHHQRLARAKIANEAEQMAVSQSDLTKERLESETEAFLLRSTLAKLEYDLLAKARKSSGVSSYIEFIKTSGAFEFGVPVQTIGSQSEAATGVDTRTGLTTRIERVLSIAAALNAEKIVDENELSLIREKVASISQRGKSLLSRISMQGEIDRDMQKRLRTANSEGLIDREKVLLPRFLANGAYLGSLNERLNPSEDKRAAVGKVIYTKQLSHFILIGMVLGGSIAYIALAILSILNARSGAKQIMV